MGPSSMAKVASIAPIVWVLFIQIAPVASARRIAVVAAHNATAAAVTTNTLSKYCGDGEGCCCQTEATGESVDWDAPLIEQKATHVKTCRCKRLVNLFDDGKWGWFCPTG